MTPLPSPRHLLPRVLGALVALVAILPTSDARASDPSFGANDIPTVFFIDKSDDHNRVDYGIRLDANCAPVNAKAVFPYWRVFEKSPPVRTQSLAFYEYVPYGFSEQRTLSHTATGGEQLIRLKQLARPIIITTTKNADGKCSAVAHTTVSGSEGAELASVFVKLGGVLSVDYIDIHGKNAQSGAALTERVKK